MAKSTVGLDAGATLTKIAVRTPGEEPWFELAGAGDRDQVSRRVQEIGPARVGITGAGATALASRLPFPCACVSEFEAWGAGADAMLTAGGGAPQSGYLVVSVGTGTSVLLVRNGDVKRIGGTALGGGTLMGLASLVLETAPSFEELCALASRGDRRRVDLLISDIYPADARPFPAELNAASFGKLGLGAPPPAPEDLAHAVMGLVGENVALICGSLAAASGIPKVVFGGSTLRGNRALKEILQTVLGALGREPVFLDRGEFTGALGALRLATEGA